MQPKQRGAYVPARCPSCGHVAVGRIEQAVFGDPRNLGLTGHFDCGYCRATWDIQRIEPQLPEPYRRALLEAEGRWGLRLRDTRRRIHVVKLLRERLSLSLQRASERAGRLDTPVHVGTWTECSWLQELCAQADIGADVVPADLDVELDETDEWDELEIPF